MAVILSNSSIVLKSKEFIDSQARAADVVVCTDGFVMRGEGSGWGFSVCLSKNS